MPNPSQLNEKRKNNDHEKYDHYQPLIISSI